MADETVAADDLDVIAPKKSPLPWILAAVNLAALAGLGGYMMVGGDDATALAAAAESGAEAAEAEPVEEGSEAGGTGIGPLFRMETFIVNLNEPGGNRYLKVGLELELQRSAMQESVEKARPVLRHRAIAYLSNLTRAQTQGLVGKERIRLDLLNRFNSALGRTAVRGVYFTDFLIQ